MQNFVTTGADGAGNSLRITRPVATGSTSPQPVFRINPEKPAAISLRVCEIATTGPAMSICHVRVVGWVLRSSHFQTISQINATRLRTHPA